VAPLNKMIDLGMMPLLGSDNVMLNSPNMLRELEFSLKLMSVYYNSYIEPSQLLKMATTNVCITDSLSEKINKSYIEEGQNAEFMIANQKSNNPYLSLINRAEVDDIIDIF
jgi:cytosine/adenosine deaminase-related metal-dependent hydrolase